MNITSNMYVYKIKSVQTFILYICLLWLKNDSSEDIAEIIKMLSVTVRFSKFMESSEQRKGIRLSKTFDLELEFKIEKN